MKTRNTLDYKILLFRNIVDSFSEKKSLLLSLLFRNNKLSTDVLFLINVKTFASHCTAYLVITDLWGFIHTEDLSVASKICMYLVFIIWALGFINNYYTYFFSDYSLSPSSSVSALTSTSSLNIPQSLTLNSTAHHNTPPSRVIHCRAVADGCKETDLINVLQPFGKIT